MTGYAQSRGVPAARAAVLLGGLLLLLGGLSVLLGVWADLGALLLLVFLVPTAVLMHGFWKESTTPRRVSPAFARPSEWPAAQRARRTRPSSHTGSGVWYTTPSSPNTR
jgi:uncharacterized membrane protein YphA (DoxX/SURF4 family)